MELAEVLRCCAPPPRTAVRKTLSGIASSTRTHASRPRPRPSGLPGCGAHRPAAWGRSLDHQQQSHAQRTLKGFAMDTVASFAQRREELASSVATATVTATYFLSEEGRKASLLAGGDGRAVQELMVNVPTNRLHLVSVDANGVARLKLRPRFEMDGEQRVVRVDAPPTYDSPPDIDELFREAARNHQLERTYEAERRSAKTKRREADAERRADLAKVFLNDPAQRALVHPAPTPKRCWLGTA